MLPVAGDWLAGQTMESAWLSATALAGRVLNHIAEQQATVELEPNTSQQLDLLSVAGEP